MQKKSYDVLREVIRRRRTVRGYTSAPVPEDDVRRILDAARYAPSSGNEQPWVFLVVRDRRRIDQLRDAAVRITLDYCRTKLGMSDDEVEAQRTTPTEYVAGCLSAPVLVAVLVDKEAKWARYSRHDGAVARRQPDARGAGAGLRNDLQDRRDSRGRRARGVRHS